MNDVLNHSCFDNYNETNEFINIDDNHIVTISMTITTFLYIQKVVGISQLYYIYNLFLYKFLILGTNCYSN